jgi:phosphohistidine phosphatase
MPTKLLYLLRHAKAESANATLLDEDRALTERGIGDVKKLANKLQKKELNFDVLLTSPAIRAITTAQIIANTLDHRQYHLEVEKKLYHASPDNLLTLLAGLPKKASRVLIVGHNPGLEEFAQLLCGERVEMQTCGLIQITLDLKRWKDFKVDKFFQMKIIN